METLVATVLIVIIFMITSAILNNIFSSSIKNSTIEIDAHLNELEYLYKNDKLKLPYENDFNKWNVTLEEEKQQGHAYIVIYATNKQTKKQLTRTIE
ncbi:hypothetical protein [Pontimicrobium sp. SW4]|uniref:Type II secretion system protein n=1 Tax=Pontimicrobium sp. SW4 TaxID=3153519 RepID=A0AAU7BQ56_9FLAO